MEEQKAACVKFEWYTIIWDDRLFQIGYLDVDHFEMSLNQEGFQGWIKGYCLKIQDPLSSDVTYETLITRVGTKNDHNTFIRLKALQNKSFFC